MQIIVLNLYFQMKPFISLPEPVLWKKCMMNGLNVGRHELHNS